MLVEQTVRDFLKALGSAEPVPGGGSASALAGALAANLFAMVIALTLRKESEKAGPLRPAELQVMALAEACTRLVDRDAGAYQRVRDAYRLPRDTEEEKIQRRMEIQLAMREASTVPLELAERCVELVAVGADIARLGRSSAISDAGVANFLALAAVMGAVLNVEINLPAVEDEEFVRNATDRVAALQEKSRALFDATQQIVLDRLYAST